MRYEYKLFLKLCTNVKHDCFTYTSTHRVPDVSRYIPTYVCTWAITSSRTDRRYYHYYD